MSVAPVTFITLPNGIGNQISGQAVADSLGADPTSVAISADTTIIVGGAASNGLSDRGCAYLFTRSTATDNWIYQQQLTPPANLATAVLAGLNFGRSVAITNNANIVAIGANASSGGSRGGRVFLHAKNANTSNWLYYQALQASDTIANNLFGGTVSFTEDGNYLAVGAQGANAAYVFTSNSNAIYREQQKIATPIGTAASFGNAVRFSPDGNYLLVGANAYDYPGFTNRGMACMYKKDTGTANWSLVQNISTPSIPGSLFATTCDMSYDGTYAIFGCGVVSSFFFKKTVGTDYWDCLQSFTTSDTFSGGFLTSISYSGSNIGIGNKRLPTSDKGGVVYFQKRADTDFWVSLSTVQLSNTIGTRVLEEQGASGMLSPDGSYIVYGAPGWRSDFGNIYVSFREWVKEIPSTNSLSLISLVSSPLNTVILPKASETTNAMTWIKDTTPWRPYYSLLTISTSGGDRIDGLYSTLSFCNVGMALHFAQDKVSNWYTLNSFDEKS